MDRTAAKTASRDGSAGRRTNRGLGLDQRAESHRLTALGGLAALSLDALSSVAYGPEAVVLVLVAAGAATISWTLPIAIAIAALLLVLVISYRQVIAVHPDGGGAYAVAKKDINRPVSLLAAASLIVDYVLTVAVSLAAGAASLASIFPALANHPLAVTLLALAVITMVNLIGIAESAKVLMIPTLVFIFGILATIFVGFFRPHPVAMIGSDLGPIRATEALGLVLILKAFSAGCSALTGVEAIANAVPAFRSPQIKRAQNCEVALGVLLGVMLVGLAGLIRLHNMVPRGDVTILAQLTAAAFGTGWPFYVTNLAVVLVLGCAANTSFGGLPVLLQLLAKDNRMPHLFALRSERPVYRYGVSALAILAFLLLLIVGADTQRLLPVYAIGVFIGFTISQTGLVRHWRHERGKGWTLKALLNGSGAALTAVASVVLFATKFTEGAWLLLLIVPSLMLLFDRNERYYDRVGKELGLGRTPAKPVPGADPHAMVIVPIVAVSLLAERVLQAAMRLGGELVAVAVDIDPDETHRLTEQWKQWSPGVDLRILPSPNRSVVPPLLTLVRSELLHGRHVTVLLGQVEPRRRRYRILHNQRGIILAAALRIRTDAVVATLVVRLD
jgi:amino acid transporter